MKATLRFNLDDPDQRQAHMRCIKSTSMAMVLWELVHNGHRHLEEKLTPEQYQGAKEVLTMINDQLQEHYIFIDELIN